MKNKGNLKIKHLGEEGNGTVMLLQSTRNKPYLKVRFTKGTGEYSPEDVKKMNIEVIDLTRKDLRALRKAGFSLVLKPLTERIS